MAASDKARFFLELSVTELNTLERKKVFTREEISSIAKTRSDFEHIVNAQGSCSSDYLRYIEFEKNVNALRRKRVQRLGVRYRGTGQATLYSLYNRATRKFSGDLTLWIQYIEFVRKDKAYKRLNDIFTSVARLHPTNQDIWILAAHYFMDTQADITNSRSYMQRGLRFCKKSEHLWLEYAKLETIYVGKIAGRRRILGLDNDGEPKPRQNENETEDKITLPIITMEDINPSLKQGNDVDKEAFSSLASAPVLTGAIPIAIFDSAMKEFNGSSRLAASFFEMFIQFEELPCMPGILQHVLDFLQQSAPMSLHVAACTFQKCLFGISPYDHDSITCIRDALDTVGTAIQKYPKETGYLLEVVIRRLLALTRIFNSEDDLIQKALKGALRKYVRVLGTSNDTEAVITKIVCQLQQDGRNSDAEALIRISIRQWPESVSLQKKLSLVKI